MRKQSVNNTILINIGAFLLVLILELLSGWMNIDRYDSLYSFFLWGLGLTTIIMVAIWINHLVLIPYFLDKRRYFLYTILLIGSVFFVAYLRGYEEGGWLGVSKFFFFLLYTTGTGMGVFFLSRNIMSQKKNDEKDKLQKEMELNYLKEQVNPHFLFNSLNSIYSLSRQQSPETPDLVMQLSDLMRYQIESAKKDTVLLKDEIEFIENYLLLEEKRLSNRCTIEFVIIGDVIDLQIAPMLLIPFVENAIKHGAHSTNEQSTIDITATLDNKVIKFSVENSVPLNIAKSKRKGMGLENVKRRLNLLYPDSHQLDIDEIGKVYKINLSINLSVSTFNNSL